MKRTWTAEELLEHFTLLPDELVAIGNKSGTTRLGFAVLLKCFQYEGRFLRSRQETAPEVVRFLATQVGVDAALFAKVMCGKGEPSKRMAQWEYGKDIDYLTHKSIQAHIESFTGSERGTSSQCPVCGHRHKPRGRVWACKVCGFQGHRDVVGSANMHRLAYGQQVTFPRLVTYLRPGSSRRSSRAGTPHASQDAC